MIVRIAGEDQYRIDDGQHDRLDELDTAVVDAVSAGDEAAFRTAFDALLAFVRKGEVVPHDEMPESDVFVPFADLSLDEAREAFTGEGVVPD